MSKISAAITAVGSFVPEHKLTNQMLEEMVDTNDDWITTRTGIKERRIISQDESFSALCSSAGTSAIQMAGFWMNHYNPLTGFLLFAEKILQRGHYLNFSRKLKTITSIRHASWLLRQLTV